ncbi:hypothetical protein EUX98_g5471 [Antrodiella citrinella]|uniref:Uncharacterized protein n=1 Tax=Antrodiella citrinella TaxID=2447956 RepID=A0A4S4MRC5_9APHY|nr:hypothetical protein EUX98_g5471 [Antrodiella citrinella]
MVAFHDILLCFRNSITADLHTHIALSQTCRRLSHLYIHDDEFWQFVCFGAGFGRPLRRGGVEFGNILTWRRLAHVLVNHASHCEIRSCREANAELAEHRSRTFQSPFHPGHGPADILLHPLYFYLHFSGPCAEPSPDTLSVLLTHLPTFPECRASQYGPLCSHPNASCAFATFPPMQSLDFQDAHGNTYLSVQNPDGCTILDVNRALAALIPNELAALEIVLAHYQDLIRTSGLSKHQWADMVSKERGFLDDHEYPFLQELVAQA